MPADVPRFHVEEQDHGLDKSLDRILIEKSRPAIEKGEKVQFIEVARNVNRSVGAMLSGALTKVHPEGLPDDTIRIQLEGTGGQSFGAFLAKGITLYLIGDANDYTGKGLSGGRIVVRPSIDFRGVATSNIIIGNTALYGATTGEAFFSGVAGERFAVRLSGATAVVEGTGDHGCEYMTGGTVRGAGQDRPQLRGRHVGRHRLRVRRGRRVRQPLQHLHGVAGARGHARPSRRPTARPALHKDQADEALLKKLLEEHNRWTGSKRARELLDNWATARTKFVKVFPNEYKRALAEMYEREVEAASSGNNAACGDEADTVGCRPEVRGREERIMGKITGFMEFERVEEGYQPVPERVKHYKEFVIGARRRAGQGAGRALHGLRHAVLQQRLPGQQHHSGLQRPGVPAGLAERLDGAGLDQQLPGIHRPHLPRALRGGLHAERERRPGGHQVDRARHHRPRLGERLGRSRVPAQDQDRQEGGRGRLRPGRHGGGAAAGARRP